MTARLFKMPALTTGRFDGSFDGDGRGVGATVGRTVGVSVTEGSGGRLELVLIAPLMFVPVFAFGVGVGVGVLVGVGVFKLMLEPAFN